MTTVKTAKIPTGTLKLKKVRTDSELFEGNFKWVVEFPDGDRVDFDTRKNAERHFNRTKKLRRTGEDPGIMNNPTESRKKKLKKAGRRGKSILGTIGSGLTMGADKLGEAGERFNRVSDALTIEVQSDRDRGAGTPDMEDFGSDLQELGGVGMAGMKSRKQKQGKKDSGDDMQLDDLLF